MIAPDNEAPWIWFFQARLNRPFSAESFRAAREELVESCARQGIAAVHAWDLSAAADELLCNVLEHSDAQWLDLGVCQNAVDSMLRLRLLDNGQRFDVALAADKSPELAGDGNNRHLGLVMVSTRRRDVKHRRRGTWNGGGRHRLADIRSGWRAGAWPHSQRSRRAGG
jgi:anti-sigma regulatory factor (Ser/Thr protein kinase)